MTKKATPVQFVIFTGGVASLLGAGFIFCKVAKITDIANLSWFWVLSPFWMQIALGLVIVILFVIGILILLIYNRIRLFFKNRKRLKNMMNEPL